MLKPFIMLLIVLSALGGRVQAADAVFSFGISPQKSATQLATAWIPLLKWVSRHAGVDLKFYTARDSETFSDRLRWGDYDFCFVNPQQYVLLNDRVGYRALAHEKDRLLQGLLVTRKDSGIETLSDLNGKQLAFPSRTSFAASVLIQAELSNAGIKFTPNYVGSHASVYLNVAKGLFEAGGGITRSLDLAPPEVRDQLKVIVQTKGYTPHAFASHPRVSDEVRARVQAAFKAINKDESAKPLLEAIGFSGIELAEDSAWDGLRELHLPAVRR